MAAHPAGAERRYEGTHFNDSLEDCCPHPVVEMMVILEPILTQAHDDLVFRRMIYR
ncbi:hypothetical protein IFR05_012599, partial [Cadophora sp. M221]